MSPVARKSIRACPICGGHEAVPLHEQRFTLPEGSPLPSAYTVASCDHCGACFADTPAPQRDYDRYYEQFSRYDDPALGTGGGATLLDRERLQETAALIAAQPLPRGTASRMLDIGCAGGGLLTALAERGFHDLAGMDPSPTCVERVLRQGFDCRQGKLSDPGHAHAATSYDIVILSHVVEHLVDVRAALRAARALLAADGACYVEVPDPSRYSADAFVPFYFFDCEHINHFDRAALRNLAGVSGLDVVGHGERDLRVDGGGLYPAAWSLFRKGAATRTPVPDMTLRATLAEYIEHSARTTGHGPLIDLEHSQCPVLLWGAGSHAQRLLQSSPLARCNLIGVVDGDPGKQGRAILGHTIRPPEAVLSRLAPDVAIVVASVLHGGEIAVSISEAGLRNHVVVAR